ncbi:conserved hypothetical protein [Nostocoides japonicum T1-X7]|uniref:Cobalamin (Vitamin B12) biosynthesis CbiX protein n=1 Tax=Nostocoides japonicum T1-X7 TaxID=1194083 RepID=A0A077M1J0_9MICO|nr:sirohydrochlorin chelatase [Tetrasphaera japonica]CCH79701.1 conserved hypothetical protein [Tetrasphaera japonica T1-X7]
MTSESVVLVAHGTEDPVGRGVSERIRDAVAARLPEVVVDLAYADVVEPRVGPVLARHPHATIVPLFLASGYHVRTDLPAIAADHPGARLTAPLGPSPALLPALSDRLAETAAASGVEASGVVLVAAGSSRDCARLQVWSVADELESRLGIPVQPAFLNGASPTLAEARAALPADARERAVAVSYLLAPGFFQERLARQATDLGMPFTAPLACHPAVVDAVLGLVSTSPTGPSR